MKDQIKKDIAEIIGEDAPSGLVTKLATYVMTVKTGKKGEFRGYKIREVRKLKVRCGCDKI